MCLGLENNVHFVVSLWKMSKQTESHTRASDVVALEVQEGGWDIVHI